MFGIQHLRHRLHCPGQWHNNMPNCPMFLTLSSFYLRNVLIQEIMAAKFNFVTFVTFLKDPGMALTSGMLHLEKKQRATVGLPDCRL